MEKTDEQNSQTFKSKSAYSGPSKPIEPWKNIETRDAMDAKMGFSRFTEGPNRIGWLVNLQEVFRTF